MGELDKPWNCPHGRPTMRHVRDLKSLDVWKGDMDEIEWDRYATITDDEEEEDYEEGGDEGSGFDGQEPEEEDIDEMPEEEDSLWQGEEDLMLKIESAEL